MQHVIYALYTVETLLSDPFGEEVLGRIIERLDNRKPKIKG